MGIKVLVAARWPVGGIRTYLGYLFSQPIFEGCEIDIVAPGTGLKCYMSKTIPAGRVKVTQCGDSMIDLCRSIRSPLTAGNYDLLHTQGLTTAMIGQFARLGAGIPHLASIHDVFSENTFAGPMGRAKQAAINIGFRSIEAVHAVSEDCGVNFHQYVPCVPSERIYSILNGIDVDRFAECTPIDARSELGIPRETRLIGFFGRFMAQKGFRTLVDAVDVMLQTFTMQAFRVLTFGWGGFIREDFEYLRAKGLGEVFVQVPHTDSPEKWMKAMDVIAMPSRSEACGLVAMEALTAGVPIVATNCVGLAEVLAGSPARLVNPDDPGALASELIRALESPNELEFKKYQSMARRRFAAGRQAAEIFQLYESLVCGTVARGN